MNLPLETVVELLMANAGYLESGGTVYVAVEDAPFKFVRGINLDELRAAIRDYLSTLVPQPVKLSECEEGEWFEANQPVQRWKDHAYNPMGVIIGIASEYEVIQPAEVTNER